MDKIDGFVSRVYRACHRLIWLVVGNEELLVIIFSKRGRVR